MANQQSTLSVAIRATKALFSNLGVVVPIAAVMGALIASIDLVIFNHFQIPMTAGAAANQTGFIKVMLSWEAVRLLAEVFLGPIVVAMTIYTARTHTHGGKATLYKAFNFALARYSRIFKWHAITWLAINVGMSFCFVGILFLLQYAFVDAILCLEDEKWPLARSAKLTRGRRGRIFALAAPLILVQSVISIADLMVLGWEEPLFVLAGLKTVLFMANIWLFMAFYMFYEDRTKAKTGKSDSA